MQALRDFRDEVLLKQYLSRFESYSNATKKIKNIFAYMVCWASIWVDLGWHQNCQFFFDPLFSGLFFFPKIFVTCRCSSLMEVRGLAPLLYPCQLAKRQQEDSRRLRDGFARLAPQLLEGFGSACAGRRIEHD
jgi:hypothetical protein